LDESFPEACLSQVEPTKTAQALHSVGGRHDASLIPERESVNVRQDFQQGEDTPGLKRPLAVSHTRLPTACPSPPSKRKRLMMSSSPTEAPVRAPDRNLEPSPPWSRHREVIQGPRAYVSPSPTYLAGKLGLQMSDIQENSSTRSAKDKGREGVPVANPVTTSADTSSETRQSGASIFTFPKPRPLSGSRSSEEEEDDRQTQFHMD